MSPVALFATLSGSLFWIIVADCILKSLVFVRGRGIACFVGARARGLGSLDVCLLDDHSQVCRCHCHLCTSVRVLHAV